MEKLRKLREKKGLTQKQIAKRLGVTVMSVCGWETGRFYPSIPNLQKLAKYFKLPIEKLITPPPQTKKNTA